MCNLCAGFKGFLYLFMCVWMCVCACVCVCERVWESICIFVYFTYSRCSAHSQSCETCVLHVEIFLPSTEDWWKASSHGATTVTWSSVWAKPVMVRCTARLRIWILLQNFKRLVLYTHFPPERTEHRNNHCSFWGRKVNVPDLVSKKIWTMLQSSLKFQSWCWITAKKVILQHMMMSWRRWLLNFWVMVSWHQFYHHSITYLNEFHL